MNTAIKLKTAPDLVPHHAAKSTIVRGALITLGFEHSIANFYLLPTGLLAGVTGSLRAALANLVAVTLGNLVGGIGVALAFWMAYLRRTHSKSGPSGRLLYPMRPARPFLHEHCAEELAGLMGRASGFATRRKWASAFLQNWIRSSSPLTSKKSKTECCISPSLLAFFGLDMGHRDRTGWLGM